MKNFGTKRMLLLPVFLLALSMQLAASPMVPDATLTTGSCLVAGLTAKAPMAEPECPTMDTLRYRTSSYPAGRYLTYIYSPDYAAANAKYSTYKIAYSKYTNNRYPTDPEWSSYTTHVVPVADAARLYLHKSTKNYTAAADQLVINLLNEAGKPVKSWSINASDVVMSYAKDDASAAHVLDLSDIKGGDWSAYNWQFVYKQDAGTEYTSSQYGMFSVDSIVTTRRQSVDLSAFPADGDEVTIVAPLGVPAYVEFPISVYSKDVNISLRDGNFDIFGNKGNVDFNDNFSCGKSASENITIRNKSAVQADDELIITVDGIENRRIRIVNDVTVDDEKVSCQLYDTVKYRGTSTSTNYLAYFYDPFFQGKNPDKKITTYPSKKVLVYSKNSSNASRVIPQASKAVFYLKKYKSSSTLTQDNDQVQIRLITYKTSTARKDTVDKGIPGLETVITHYDTIQYGHTHTFTLENDNLSHPYEFDLSDVDTTVWSAFKWELTYLPAGGNDAYGTKYGRINVDSIIHTRVQKVDLSEVKESLSITSMTSSYKTGSIKSTNVPVSLSFNSDAEAKERYSISKRTIGSCTGYTNSYATIYAAVDTIGTWNDTLFIKDMDGLVTYKAIPIVTKIAKATGKDTIQFEPDTIINIVPKLPKSIEYFAYTNIRTHETGYFEPEMVFAPGDTIVLTAHTSAGVDLKPTTITPSSTTYAKASKDTIRFIKSYASPLTFTITTPQDTVRRAGKDTIIYYKNTSYVTHIRVVKPEIEYIRDPEYADYTPFYIDGTYSITYGDSLNKIDTTMIKGGGKVVVKDNHEFEVPGIFYFTSPTTKPLYGDPAKKYPISFTPDDQILFGKFAVGDSVPVVVSEATPTIYELQKTTDTTWYTVDTIPDFLKRFTSNNTKTKSIIVATEDTVINRSCATSKLAFENVGTAHLSVKVAAYPGYYTELVQPMELTVVYPTVTVTTDPTYENHILFGQPLSYASITPGVVWMNVPTDDREWAVSGTWDWQYPDSVLALGTHDVQIVFTPDSKQYPTLEYTATVIVEGTALYYHGANAQWSDKENWWLDNTFTVSANRLPNETDSVVILAPLTISAEEVSVAALTLIEDELTINPTGCLNVETLSLNSDINLLHIAASNTATGALRVKKGLVNGAERMPLATVESWCNAYYYSGADYAAWQYVGTPVSNCITLDAFRGKWLYKYNEAAMSNEEAWLTNGDYNELEPFCGYMTTQLATEDGDLLTYNGRLVSTQDKDIPLQWTTGSIDEGLNIVANSWTAPIDMKKFDIDEFTANKVYPYIYIFNTGSNKDIEDNGAGAGSMAGQYIVYPVESGSALPGEYIIPAMQGFMAYANGSAATLHLDYEALVWNGEPTHVNTPLYAPRRENNSELVHLTITGNGRADELSIIAAERYTDNFELGSDAMKMYGTTLNPQIYATTADGPMCVLATNQLEGAVIGLKAATGSELITYTIRMSDSRTNSDLYLLDTRTGARTLIDNNASYTFFMEADTEDATRFEIVGSQHVITSCENIQVDGEKRIYDIQGRLIRNEQDILPGGVYIIRQGDNISKVVF